MHDGGDGRENQGSGQNPPPDASTPSRHSHSKIMSTSNSAQTQQANAYKQIREFLTPLQGSLDIYLLNIDAGLLAGHNLEEGNPFMQDLTPGVAVLIIFGRITADVSPGLTLLD